MYYSFFIQSSLNTGLLSPTKQGRSEAEEVIRQLKVGGTSFYRTFLIFQVLKKVREKIQNRAKLMFSEHSKRPSEALKTAF